MALARAITDGRSRVVGGPGVLPCSITRRVSGRDRVAHVLMVGQANELRIAHIERRHLDVHRPPRYISDELPEWGRHAPADGLGLRLAALDRAPPISHP